MGCVWKITEKQVQKPFTHIRTHTAMVEYVCLCHSHILTHTHSHTHPEFSFPRLTNASITYTQRWPQLVWQMKNARQATRYTLLGPWYWTFFIVKVFCQRFKVSKFFSTKLFIRKLIVFIVWGEELRWPIKMDGGWGFGAIQLVFAWVTGAEPAKILCSVFYTHKESLKYVDIACTRHMSVCMYICAYLGGHKSILVSAATSFRL